MVRGQAISTGSQQRVGIKLQEQRCWDGKLWAPDTGVPVWQHSGMVPNDLCGKEGKVLRVQEAKDLVWERDGEMAAEQGLLGKV